MLSVTYKSLTLSEVMWNVVRCAECRCSERRYAECRGAFFVMLSIMLSVVMPSVCTLGAST